MTRYAYEMQGTIVAWGDLTGEILTEDGERIYLSPHHLQLLGIKQTPKIGDRISFSAARRVDVTYRVQSVRMLVPAKLDNAKLRKLKDLNRALRKDRNPHEVWSAQDIERFAGTLESFDRKTGGTVVADTGERIEVSLLTLRNGRFRAAKTGDRCELSANETERGWQALQIFALEDRRPKKTRLSAAPRRKSPSRR